MINPIKPYYDRTKPSAYSKVTKTMQAYTPGAALEKTVPPSIGAMGVIRVDVNSRHFIKRSE